MDEKKQLERQKLQSLGHAMGSESLRNVQSDNKEHVPGIEALFRHLCLWLHV